MPWLLEAMKDVISCDKLRGGANNLRSEDLRMGKPDTLKTYHPVYRRLTQGTETSKYLEEKKTIVIPIVAASELGRAQTNLVSATLGL